jgi:hypothetical protein
MVSTPQKENRMFAVVMTVENETEKDLNRRWAAKRGDLLAPAPELAPSSRHTGYDDPMIRDS